MNLTLKTVAGQVFSIELGGSNSTVADLVTQAEAAHGFRVKAVVSSGAVLADSSKTLAAAGLVDGAVVVLLLYPALKPEPEPEPQPEQAVAEDARQQRLHKQLGAAVPLASWISQLPETVRTTRSICELALPCAQNAGARSMLCIPRPMLAKFVGDSMAAMPMVEQIARPIASGLAICQSQTVPELLASGV